VRKIVVYRQCGHLSSAACFLAVLALRSRQIDCIAFAVEALKSRMILH